MYHVVNMDGHGEPVYIRSNKRCCRCPCMLRESTMRESRGTSDLGRLSVVASPFAGFGS
jgi:hypothetical protein